MSIEQDIDTSDAFGQEQRKRRLKSMGLFDLVFFGIRDGGLAGHDRRALELRRPDVVLTVAISTVLMVWGSIERHRDTAEPLTSPDVGTGSL